jgi:hypothetical protein
MYLVFANHVFEDSLGVFTDQLRIYIARLLGFQKWVQREPDAFPQARLYYLLTGLFLLFL